jgi:hypothetical protein
MNFKESLVYNNKFFFEKNKYLDDSSSNETNDNIIIDSKYFDIRCPLIDFIKNKYEIKELNYNLFINKIEEIFGNFILCVSKDEDDKYVLINKCLINSDIIINELETFTTTIYQKNPFKKICSFITHNSTNNNAIVTIKNTYQTEFDNLIIKNSMEGINLILFYDETWKFISEKSLFCNDTYYRNKKLITLVEDVIYEKKINLDILDKKNMYYFVLLHHKNNGILNFNHYGSGYKELYLDFYLENENNKFKINLNPYLELSKRKINIKFVNKANFKNISELIDGLNQLSYDNMSLKKITLEGYNIYVIKENTISLYKLQTHIYQQVLNTKPKYFNIHQGYLELYQENKLKEYLPYFTNYHSEITHRISMSVRTISKEFLDIYHFLKKTKKQELYNNIPNTYKKILYKIHGIYIDSRKNDFIKNEKKEEIDKEDFDENKHDTKSITVHDIYHYLKSLSTSVLKQIYLDRESLIKDKKINENIYKLIVQDCIYTMTQTKLMIMD